MNINTFDIYVDGWELWIRTFNQMFSSFNYLTSNSSCFDEHHINIFIEAKI